MIVIDEIHQSKSRKENTTSQRRELIKEFIRISSNLKEELKVLGLSATPVINNLYEGRSLIELVTEKTLDDVRGDDINSCMNLYQHFILNSIRMNPGNLSRTQIIKKDIDTSNLLKNIIEIHNSPKLVKYHDLERLFVLPKLRILDEVIEEGVKTIIFITLIKGTLIPITNWLKNKNKKFSVYTGDDKDASEEGFVDSLDEFINGDTEVLVATIQCAGTGIDGLQSVCNKAVFFQLPWTSTEFEQSVGRLDRDGTEFDSIDVFLPVTYLELPNGDVWSWCESKLDRISSK
jgi:superfamily II DNA/RNA helicase